MCDKIKELLNEVLSEVLDATIAMDAHGASTQPSVALYGLGNVSADLRARVEEWGKKYQLLLDTPS